MRNSKEQETVYVTKAELEELIDERLGTIKVIISEADITQAQEGIKAIVEQAEF